MKNIKFLAIIPARKNSKRIKNKNLIQLGKKKLIERTIDFALKISDKNFIYLSTDSTLIQKIGKKYGIYCPNLRPSHLSKENSKTVDVAIHAIKEFEKKKKLKIKNLILLQPTSPFRTLNLFKKTYNKFKKNFRPTITATPLFQSKIVKKIKGKFSLLNNKVKNYYEINGNIYIITTEKLKTKKSFFSSPINIVITNSKKLSLDIDTIYDLEKAKNYLK